MFSYVGIWLALGDSEPRYQKIKKFLGKNVFFGVNKWECVDEYLKTNEKIRQVVGAEPVISGCLKAMPS